MSVIILNNESVASNRCVPIWCVQSNGTSAATNESGRTFMFEIGGVFYGSGGSISAVSATDGLYTCIFSASKISVPGVGQVMYSSGTALPVSAPFVVVPSMWNRIISTATCSAGGANTITLNSVETATADQFSGACITVQYRDGSYQDNVIKSYSAARVATCYNSWVSVPVSGMTYWLQPGGSQAWSCSTVSDIRPATYSGVSVGASNFAPGTYSGVSFSLRDGGIATTTFQAGNYSGVSVEVKSGGIQTTSIGAGNYSGVSVEVKTKGIDTNSIVSASYSGVSFEIKSGGIQTSSVGAGNYSGVSFEVKSGGIQAASVGAGTYSGVSVEVKTGGIQTNSIGSATYSGVTFGANPVGDKTLYSINSIVPGTYSGVSVEVKTGGIQTASVGAGSYSGMSVEIKTGGIQPASMGAGAYSGVTVDGAKFLSAAGERSAASSLLSTNLGGTTAHYVQQAIELLRNKVLISGSTMTVFQTDGATSSWTATISTGTATVYGVTPLT